MENDREGLRPGTRVEVWNDFGQGWARGFEVVDVAGDGVRIRRQSDGTVLPATFEFDATRPE
jgi:hypothetical protein